MKKYKGACVLLLGLIAAAGAIETGYGWFTSSAIISIGITLIIQQWREGKHAKKSNSNNIEYGFAD